MGEGPGSPLSRPRGGLRPRKTQNVSTRAAQDFGVVDSNAGDRSLPKFSICWPGLHPPGKSVSNEK